MTRVRRWGWHLRVAIGLAAAPAAAWWPALPPARAEGIGLLTHEHAGIARLLRPDGAALGLVLVLPDALGGDPRSEPYADALAAQGFAVLEPQWQEVPPAEQAMRGRALLAALPGIAAGLGVPAASVGVLGFGLGGHIALMDDAAHGLPTAALYPGCARLLEAAGTVPPRAAATPVLLLHGSADGAEPEGACAAVAARLGAAAQRHEYFGATYGWDYAPGSWLNMTSLLLGPAVAGGRRRAHATPAVTQDAAWRVAGFLARHIGAGAQLAAGSGGQ